MNYKWKKDLLFWTKWYMTSVFWTKVVSCLEQKRLSKLSILPSKKNHMHIKLFWISGYVCWNTLKKNIISKILKMIVIEGFHFLVHHPEIFFIFSIPNFELKKIFSVFSVELPLNWWILLLFSWMYPVFSNLLTMCLVFGNFSSEFSLKLLLNSIDTAEILAQLYSGHIPYNYSLLSSNLNFCSILYQIFFRMNLQGLPKNLVKGSKIQHRSRTCFFN